MLASKKRGAKIKAVNGILPTKEKIKHPNKKIMDEYDLELKGLRKAIKDSKSECSSKHKKLQEKVLGFCEKHPQKCSKKSSSVVDKEERPVACGAGFNHCRATIYTYKNGNKKIVTWYKKVKKSMQKNRQNTIGDCSCNI